MGPRHERSREVPLPLGVRGTVGRGRLPSTLPTLGCLPTHAKPHGCPPTRGCPPTPGSFPIRVLRGFPTPASGTATRNHWLIASSVSLLRFTRHYDTARAGRGRHAATNDSNFGPGVTCNDFHSRRRYALYCRIASTAFPSAKCAAISAVRADSRSGSAPTAARPTSTASPYRFISVRRAHIASDAC